VLVIDEFSRSLQKIKELSVPLATLSQLCGISVGHLSALTNRQKPCDNQTAAKIWKAVHALDGLMQDLAPVPVDLRRAIVLRDILIAREEGSFKTVVVNDKSILHDTVENIVSWALENPQGGTDGSSR